MHEYRALLDSGTTGIELDTELEANALESARDLWPATGFGPWDSIDRQVCQARSTTDGATAFVHVDGDWPDCFVILGFENGVSHATFFFVLDIGAEYSAVTLDCPSMPYNGPVDTELIELAVYGLKDDQDSFLVLNSGRSTYMQAYRNSDGGYVLEHQVATLKSHYVAARVLTAVETIETLKSYAFGKKEWAFSIDWRPQPL
jgi:hypothetical protein